MAQCVAPKCLSFSFLVMAEIHHAHELYRVHGSIALSSEITNGFLSGGCFPIVVLVYHQPTGTVPAVLLSLTPSLPTPSEGLHRILVSVYRQCRFLSRCLSNSIATASLSRPSKFETVFATTISIFTNSGSVFSFAYLLASTSTRVCI